MIALDNVTVRNGSFKLEGISFTIPTGEYGILMGKTGCGKTTLLEAICGLKRVTTGRVLLTEEDVTRLKPGARGIGFVPQDGALFSTMTVERHLAFALDIRRWPKKRIRARVDELAELLGIRKLLHRKPLGLSGGEAQRVALGRALAPHPRILCLDEPLSALDHETREEMCVLLETIKTRLGVTILHITHDLNEAERLADQTFRLVGGKIARVRNGDRGHLLSTSASIR